MFDQFVSVHRTWVSLISSSLAETFPGVVTQLTAINGKTTGIALDRLFFSVNSHAPKYVFFQYGIKDANSWESEAGIPRVPPESFKSNLRELINRTLASGAEKIFVGTNHAVRAKRRPLGGEPLREKVEEYNEIIRQVVSEALADSAPPILFDFARLLESEAQGLLLQDGIHLSQAGHEIYFEFALPLIESNL